MYTCHSETRGHIHKAPQEKPEDKGKLWHWITTKPETITHVKGYGGLNIQVCIRLRKLFSNNPKKNTTGT